MQPLTAADCSRASQILDAMRRVPLDISTRQLDEDEYWFIINLVANALHSEPSHVKLVDRSGVMPDLCSHFLHAEHQAPDEKEPACGSFALLAAKLESMPPARRPGSLPSFETHQNHHARLVTFLSDLGNNRQHPYAHASWLATLNSAIADDLQDYIPSPRSIAPDCIFTAAAVAITRISAQNAPPSLGALPLHTIKSLSERELKRGTVPAAVQRGVWL